MRLLQLIFVILLLMIVHFSCNLDRWNLKREDIPNYSRTIESKPISEHTSSDLIALSDEDFLIAIESGTSMIEIIKYTQKFENDTWLIEEENVLVIGNGHINFFDTIPNGYLIGYTDFSKEFNLKVIDRNFNEVILQSNLKNFIDTAYNKIVSLEFWNFDVDTSSKEIILGGNVVSQETNYSCLLKLDIELKPIWFKTYFENSTISDIAILNNDSFYSLNNNLDGTDLIIDNNNGSAYKKYDLSNDKVFFGLQSFKQDQKIFLTGIINDIARTIELNLETESAFINELKIYPVSDFRAIYLTRDNIVTAGIQTEGVESQLFASELEAFGSIWCNRYSNENYIKILDLVELPERGILISSIVERQGQFFINLTRIDEEGATFTNEYSENCI